ncbi:MAG: hypothetical protein Q8L48_30805 [Archangium sp.]|nr:hypothetical protein [Archangium sp.]
MSKLAIMSNPMRWVCGVILASATAAWPCSGEQCVREPQFANIDGGVPSNLLPLALTDLWNAFSGSEARVRQADGGLVVTQLRVVDSATALVDTAPLVEGERYQLERSAACPSFGGGVDAGGFTHDFVVLPPVPLLAGGVSIAVEDAGSGPVNQYSGASCHQGVPGSFATFRFVISPGAAPLLPFYAWRLELEPLDGGPAGEWHSEAIGTLLADGALRRVPNAQLAPRRMSTVFHSCGDGGIPASPGWPAGSYRAQLSGRLLGTDAGFVSTSAVFELGECEAASDAGQSGVDAGTGTDAGPSAVDAGMAAGEFIGPSANRGCTSAPGALLLWLAALGFLRRHRGHS